MGKHSFLSASASHRWINCPPSARLCEEYADRPSEYAQEGTDCHELCAYKVEKALGRRVKDPTENLTYYSQEMEDCADGYCAFVMEEVAKARERCSDPLVLVEQRLDYSRYVGIEDSFGTGDCVIVSDGLLHIIDYKHGLGVLVSAEQNSQLSCYALGALDLFDGIYDIERVSLTIYQPRRENVSTYTMSREELLAWAKTVLAPAAKLAYEGKGEFKAGEHCQFCKAKATCRKRAEYNLELARYDFEMPALLEDDEVAAILLTPKVNCLSPLCPVSLKRKAEAFPKMSHGVSESGSPTARSAFPTVNFWAIARARTDFRKSSPRKRRLSNASTGSSSPGNLPTPSPPH